MSAKGFGCVGIVDREGRLIGIITDGDLRRHMSATLPSQTRRRDHDAASPRPSAADALAGEALAAMNMGTTPDHHAVRRRGRQAGRHRPYA